MKNNIKKKRNVLSSGQQTLLKDIYETLLTFLRNEY